jgi:hypothetical protein
LGAYWLLGTGSFHDWMDGLHGIFYVGFYPKMRPTPKFIKTLRVSSRTRSQEYSAILRQDLKLFDISYLQEIHIRNITREHFIFLTKTIQP